MAPPAHRPGQTTCPATFRTLHCSHSPTVLICSVVQRSSGHHSERTLQSQVCTCRILGQMLGRLHRATAASSPHAQPWKRQRCEPEDRCRPSQGPGAYQHQPYGPQAEPPEAQYSPPLQPRDGLGDKENASSSRQPGASHCARPRHRSLTAQAHPAGPSAAGDRPAPGQAAAAQQLCVSCAPGGSSQAVQSGLQAECLQPPAAPQLAALDLLESRISGLITQVEAQLTLKPVQPAATSQPGVHGSPSQDASSRESRQLKVFQQETDQVGQQRLDVSCLSVLPFQRANHVCMDP